MSCALLAKRSRHSARRKHVSNFSTDPRTWSDRNQQHNDSRLNMTAADSCVLTMADYRDHVDRAVEPDLGILIPGLTVQLRRPRRQSIVSPLRSSGLWTHSSLPRGDRGALDISVKFREATGPVEGRGRELAGGLKMSSSSVLRPVQYPDRRPHQGQKPGSRSPRLLSRASTPTT
jgi:hypothetical protein